MDAPGSIVALVVAGGSGSRAAGDADLPKQYRRLAGKTVLACAIDHLRHPRIDEIRVVIGAGHEIPYREAIGGLALPAPVLGGATRRVSVRNGLEAIAAEGGASHVLIHDAARPLLPATVIDRLLNALDIHGGAVPVLPVVDTLAEADDGLGATIPREWLVRVQTPQAFRFADIFRAHESWSGPEPTDDAQMARAAGIAIATVDGDPMLEKLTYESDFRRAEAQLEGRRAARTGIGFDVHAFGPGDGVWLGGVRVPHDRGLIGHSDADVLLHAVTDALLGTIGAGDIGDHFPPGDPQWRGAPSALFLERARDLIEEAGGRIDHVDATVVCEAPKIALHRDAIRRRIADLLRLPVGSVSVKGTTTERLGFTGRGEGMAAQAVATVRLPEAS